MNRLAVAGSACAGRRDAPACSFSSARASPSASPDSPAPDWSARYSRTGRCRAAGGWRRSVQSARAAASAAERRRARRPGSRRTSRRGLRQPGHRGGERGRDARDQHVPVADVRDLVREHGAQLRARPGGAGCPRSLPPPRFVGLRPVATRLAAGRASSRRGGLGIAAWWASSATIACSRGASSGEAHGMAQGQHDPVGKNHAPRLSSAPAATGSRQKLPPRAARCRPGCRSRLPGAARSSAVFIAADPPRADRAAQNR